VFGILNVDAGKNLSSDLSSLIINSFPVFKEDTTIVAFILLLSKNFGSQYYYYTHIKLALIKALIKTLFSSFSSTSAF
jgi:hypothetical protein